MRKYQQIFEAMADGAALELSLSLGEWKSADYQAICECIASNAKFSCRRAINSHRQSALTFPAPATSKEEVRHSIASGDEYGVYYYPDTESLTVGEDRWTEVHMDIIRLEAGIVYLRKEDAQKRLKAMLEIQPCTEYTVLYHGHATE
jgi:hypothetical protein